MQQSAQESGPAVRDYLPLQQGLRHPKNNLTNNLTEVRDYLPLQQGLRQANCSRRRLTRLQVRDYLPLQQGLRQLVHGVFGKPL